MPDRSTKDYAVMRLVMARRAIEKAAESLPAASLRAIGAGYQRRGLMQAAGIVTSHINILRRGHEGDE